MALLGHAWLRASIHADLAAGMPETSNRSGFQPAAQSLIKHGGSQAGLGLLLAALAAVGFSFKAILVKLAYPFGVDTVTLLALRMAFALPVFALVWLREARRDTHEQVVRRDWLTVGALGVLGYYGSSYLDFLGLQYITAGLERLILYIYPTLVLLFSWLAFGRPIGVRELAALVLSYIGIAAVFAHDLAQAGDERAVVVGGALVLASALTYAIYLIGSGRLLARVGPARFTAHAMLCASAVVLLQFIVMRPLAALDLPWQVYGLAAAMAVFSTVLPIFALALAIRRLGSDQTALIGSIGPVATLFFGWWLLGEPISVLQLAGAALVLAGVLLVSRSKLG